MSGGVFGIPVFKGDEYNWVFLLLVWFLPLISQPILNLLYHGGDEILWIRGCRAVCELFACSDVITITGGPSELQGRLDGFSDFLQFLALPGGDDVDGVDHGGISLLVVARVYLPSPRIMKL